MSTPFFTRSRSSSAPVSMSGRQARNALSGAARSWTVSPQSKANAARFVKSSRAPDQARTLDQACRVRSKRAKQTVSQMAQLSKSPAQAFT